MEATNSPINQPSDCRVFESSMRSIWYTGVDSPIMAFTFFSVLSVVLISIISFIGCASGHLSPTFYQNTCPNVTSIVGQVMQQVLQTDPRMAASLLHLHFHDCFVTGCDASILLNNTANFSGEQTNNTFLRGFGVIDDIKTAVENECKGAVSCADLLAIAAERSVLLSGGPSWTVPLGRRDSTTANGTLSKIVFPGPTDSLSTIITKFQNVGLSATDVVPLAGSHTFGRAQCKTFSDRLYNFSGTGNPDPTLDSSYRSTLQSTCPQNGDGFSLTPLDPVTRDTFDNRYFKNLQKNLGLLQSDRDLLSTSGETVRQYSICQNDFFSDFSNSMIKMGNLSPLIGTRGEIRQNCWKVNG